MLLIFPFEEAIYREAAIPATYVGHPLAGAISPHADPAPARTELALSDAAPVVALLPGSRRAEVDYIAPVLLGCAVCTCTSAPPVNSMLYFGPRTKMSSSPGMMSAPLRAYAHLRLPMKS